MGRKQALVVCVAVLLAVGFVALVFGAATVSAPTGAVTAATGVEGVSPTAVAPGLSLSANCCLSQINKMANGQRMLTLSAPYTCDTGPTARMATRIRLRVGSAPPCDQNPGLVPNGSVLEASGSTIRRQDGFAVFTGGFTIKNPAGATLFTGTMELLDRVGSHQPPLGSESCNAQYHQEGWLHGNGAGPLSSFRLHASLAGRGPLTPTSGPQPLQARIVGALVKCP